MASPRTLVRTRRLAALAAALALAAAACSGGSAADRSAVRSALPVSSGPTTTATSPAATTAPTAVPPSSAASGTPAASRTPVGPLAPSVPAAGPLVTADPTADPAARATLAFGGDVHFDGVSRLRASGGLGSAFSAIADADAGFVNLETAVTDRGSAGPKQYTFRAPASAMVALRSAGVDAVNLANNHGEDFGQQGLADTFAAGSAADLPIIGAGTDLSAALTPWRGTLHGIRVAVFGATDVLDSFATTTWPATASRPGLASAKDEAPLLAAVRAERARSDVVVVFLHWGQERVVCPTGRQEQLAADLAGAGASAVVGSHAHVVQPERQVDGIPVFYGLGNFHFYASGGIGTVSGVATMTIGPNGVVSTGWDPARISAGQPELLSGSAARSASASFAGLCR